MFGSWQILKKGIKNIKENYFLIFGFPSPFSLDKGEEILGKIHFSIIFSLTLSIDNQTREIFYFYFLFSLPFFFSYILPLYFLFLKPSKNYTQLIFQPKHLQIQWKEHFKQAHAIQLLGFRDKGIITRRLALQARAKWYSISWWNITVKVSPPSWLI